MQKNVFPIIYEDVWYFYMKSISCISFSFYLSKGIKKNFIIDRFLDTKCNLKLWLAVILLLSFYSSI